jgi:hypothetical protein
MHAFDAVPENSTQLLLIQWFSLVGVIEEELLLLLIPFD